MTDLAGSSSASAAGSVPVPAPTPPGAPSSDGSAGGGPLDPRLAARVRPTSSSLQQRLPVAPPLAPLFPAGGLQRGTVVAVQADRAGATSLALALVAPAVAAGSWAAVVGLADVGLVAAVEHGVDLRRLVLVPCPGARWAEAAAALLDGVDVVVVGPPTVGAGVARRLGARARERRAVLVAVTGGRGWPEGAEVRLSVEPAGPAGSPASTASGRTGREPAGWEGSREPAGWEGIGGGYGYLRRRRVTVVGSGRRAAAGRRQVELWLPGPDGRPAAVG